MFEICELHIGTGKTGTTSIQECLRLNRRLLQKGSVFLPKTLGRREHVNLPAMFAQNDKLFTTRAKLGLKTEEEISAHRLALQQEATKEFKKASKKFDRVVISSERLFEQINRPAELAELISYLGQWSKKIKVYCYLRPQDEFMVSSYSTRLKHGHVGATAFPNGTKLRRNLCYADVLDFWMLQIPKEDITVRIFDKKRLKNGNLIRDFWDCMDLPSFDELQFPLTMNTSLSAEAQIFMSKLNLHFPKALNAEYRDLQKLINRTMQQLYAGTGLLPSKAEAQNYFSRFDAQNERTRAAWFPENETLFDKTWDKYPDNPISTELSQERIFEMFSQVLKNISAVP